MESEESLEIVLETMDATEVAIIKSLLEAVGIPYLTRGEDQYDAFRGAFRGTVFNLLADQWLSLFRPAWRKKRADYFKATSGKKRHETAQSGECGKHTWLGTLNIFCLLDSVAFAAQGRVANCPRSKAIVTTDLLPVLEHDAAVDAIRSVNGLITVDGELCTYREGTLRKALS